MNEIISLSILDNSKIDSKKINNDSKIRFEKYILSVSENGYGKDLLISITE